MRGDVKEAAEQLREAVDLEPSEVLYRRWRAELLTSAGDPEAADEWRHIWRDADLDTLEGLTAATWAATYQGLLKSARELSERLDRTEVMIAGERTGALVRGLTLLADGNQGGWDDIRETLDWETVVGSVREVGDNLKDLMRRGDLARRADDLQRVHALVDERVAQLAARFPTDGDDATGASAEAELTWFCERGAGGELQDVVNAAVQAVRVAFQRVAGTPPASSKGEHLPTTGGSPDAKAASDAQSSDRLEPPVVRIGMPPHWFGGFEGRESEHGMFTGALPDARAWARRALPRVVQWPAVQVWLDDDSGPDDVFAQISGGDHSAFLVHRSAWYCPPTWLVALPPERRERAAPDDSTGLHRVPEPATPLERLMSWTADDVAARLPLLLYASFADEVASEGSSP